ncbi:zinc ABC transporter substrate-binding protein [Parabacteroides sp. OttesenSCG-928-N08]|nr:zinc ABC transporter substrate-binding protein [Parabacteroides sp. OttesenSCG-928-N08]
MKQLSIFLLSLLLYGCSGGQSKENVISITIEPQRYFIEKIAGERFQVNCIVPAGQSPETYDPTPKQMMQIGKSRAYLQIGEIGFEQAWMENIKQNNPQVSFFDLSQGFSFLENEAHDHAECNGDHHHHHHGTLDPHIWSSIEGARTIAWNTLLALSTIDKEHAAEYWKNFEQLSDEINRLEQEIIALLQPLTHRAFIIYHPALTYFADEFNLRQLCIEMDGKEPSPSQLKELIDVAREHEVKVVFIQQEFDKKNAELIAQETHCRTIPINPLAYEWDKEMIRIAKSLADGQAD